MWMSIGIIGVPLGLVQKWLWTCVINHQTTAFGDEEPSFRAEWKTIRWRPRPSTSPINDRHCLRPTCPCDSLRIMMGALNMHGLLWGHPWHTA